MTRKEKHETLKRTIRQYISLRMVRDKTKRKRWDNYPQGNCDIIGKRIIIRYIPNDDLDWIDSLIIHEMGHYLAARKFGFEHHPHSEGKKIIREEIVAWNEGEKFIKPNCSYLIPKKFEKVKKYCLDTYKFVYGESLEFTDALS
jgi:hypothetical protein